MAIDPLKEQLILLDDARGLFPSNPTFRTLDRWCVAGFKGVKLEFRPSGRAKATSREAVARFLEAIS